MPEGQRWSPAMHNAWQYALRAVNEELSGAAGLRAFRAGGGSIRTQDWYALTRWSNEAYSKAEQAEDFWRAIELPESVYAPTPWRLESEYKMTAQVRYYDTSEGRYKRDWYSVSGESSRSREVWLSGLDIALKRYGAWMDQESITVTRTMFWHRE